LIFCRVIRSMSVGLCSLKSFLDKHQ
jgi:hypothetical protein